MGVSVFSAGSLLLHLLDWVRLHKADVDEKAREVLQSESPAEHRDYWDVVGGACAHSYIFKVTCALLVFCICFFICVLSDMNSLERWE